MALTVDDIESQPPTSVANPAARSGYLALIPPVAWMLVLYLIPLVILLVYAFWSVDYLTISHEFTLVNFRTFFTNALYPKVLLRTILMAAAVTVTDALIAFPIAWFLAKRVHRRQELLLLLVIFPLWSSYLVRAFAWKTILGSNGVLNSMLMSTGIIHEPLSFLLYSRYAMYLTFCQVWLPFMILPLYSVLGLIPDSLLEASADLGSGAWSTFRRVLLPLALPGIMAGALAVFSLTMGDYITPTLIGGPGDQLIGKIIADNFGAAYNWPLGAMLVIPVLLVIFGMMALANRAGAFDQGRL